MLEKFIEQEKTGKGQVKLGTHFILGLELIKSSIKHSRSGWNVSSQTVNMSIQAGNMSSQNVNTSN